MARVVLEGIAKRFGDVEVLKPIDLEVRDGELLVLLGPSGCGKSTTLRIIAGLEEPSSGRLSIGERDVTKLAPKDRDVAMVFQSYALYPHLSVRDNLAFGLKVRKTPKAEIEVRIQEAASMLGLEKLLDRKPRALSGGQRQRVAMGRAIVRRPQAFLFDEPLSNLDAALRTQMRAEIARLHKRLGVTTIYVTHDQIEALTLGTRIVIIDRGAVQQIGKPLEVYERPANGFVGRFLGSPAMNQLPGKVIEGPIFEGSGIRFPLGEIAAPHVGREVWIGLRPHALEPAEGGPISGEVELIEPTGGEAFVRIRWAELTATARITGATGLAIGDRASFRVDPAAVHLFERDPDTGEAGKAIR